MTVNGTGIIISNAPPQYRKYLAIGDTHEGDDGKDGKVNDTAEAKTAAESFCAENKRYKCEGFLDYLEKSGYALPELRENRATLLHKAVIGGDIKTVRLLLERRSDPDSAVGDLRFIPLFWKKDGGSIAGTASGGETPLYLAANNGHFEITKLLLEKGADPNKQIHDGQTPLHMAAYKGHIKIVKLLLEKGADPNIKDKKHRMSRIPVPHHVEKTFGYAPLHMVAHAEIDDTTGTNDVAFSRHLEVAKLLLEKGADPNIRDADGSPPLYTTNNLEFARLLFEKGADPNAKDDNGKTPLHGAAYFGSLKVAIFLLEKGADPNAYDNNGSTPLHLAVYGFDSRVVKLLLEKGAEPNFRDDNGNAPLHIAVSRGDSISVKLLLEKGADPNFKDDNGWTPLHIAVFSGNFKAAKLLLEKGADPNITSTKGITPKDLAKTPKMKALLEGKLK